MPLRVYDETIRVLKSAVRSAKLGREEELGALKRLDEQARLLEQKVSVGPRSAAAAKFPYSRFSTSSYNSDPFDNRGDQHYE